MVGMEHHDNDRTSRTDMHLSATERIARRLLRRDTSYMWEEAPADIQQDCREEAAIILARSTDD